MPDDKKEPEPAALGSVPSERQIEQQTGTNASGEKNVNKVDRQRGLLVSESSAKPRTKRAGSVSFKEKCQLYEIDLEATARGKARTTKQPQRPPALLSLRFYIMALALVSPFIVTYSRTIINFAIIDMIHPDFIGRKSDNINAAAAPSVQGTSPAFGAPALGNSSGAAAAAAAATNNVREYYFDLDNSCPVDDKVRERLLADLWEDKRRARETTGEKFEWDTDKQGLLKAAYAIGHMLLMVMGGRLSEIYGSQLIMSTSSCLMAISCLLAPFLASANFYLLFADLFVLGMLGSFMTPSLITLFSNWLTPSEKSLMVNFYLVSSRLGYSLSSLLCGLLINANLSWRYLFYSAGWVALAFAIVFFICSRNSPHEHPLIKQAELDYLASKNTLVREKLAAATTKTKTNQKQELEMKPVDCGEKKQTQEPTATTEEQQQQQQQQQQQEEEEESEKMDKSKDNAARVNKSKSAPWLEILTNVPVWAFIITKFCVKLAGDTVQIELPAYLQRVMHLEPKYNGYINSANYVMFCVSCLVIGLLAKVANKRRPFGWSKTVVRKLFQCTASFGVGLVLFGVSCAVCNETWTLVLFMAMFFFTTFSTGGEAQIPMDLSERYAGTIHALGGSLAISGALEPIIVGYFLRGHASDQDRWANIWLVASAVAFTGGLVFLIFGEAKIQPFDNPNKNNSTTATAAAASQQGEEIVDGVDARATTSKFAHDNKTFVSDERSNASKQNGQIKPTSGIAPDSKESELI